MKNFKYSKTLLIQINKLIELGNIELLSRFLRDLALDYFRVNHVLFDNDLTEKMIQLQNLFDILDRARDENATQAITKKQA